MTPRNRSSSATVVSRHHTSDGILTWVRDASGSLQALFHPYGSSADTEHVVAQSGHH